MLLPRPQFLARVVALLGVVALTFGVTSAAAAPDRTAPTAPPKVTARALSSASVRITWGAAKDARGVTAYLIHRTGAKRAVAVRGGSARVFVDTKLRAGTTYTYTVRARDRAGNLSRMSTRVRVRTLAASTGTNAAGDSSPVGPTVTQPVLLGPPAPTTVTPPSTPATDPPVRIIDTTAPEAPSNVLASGTSEHTATVTWDAAIDNTGVVTYEVLRGGAVVGAVDGDELSFIDSGLTVATSYTYRVRAIDAAANVGALSAPATATTPDRTAPTTPTNVTTSSPTSETVRVTWAASTDNVAVTEYVVLRGDDVVATVDATTFAFTDTSRAPRTAYSYRVRALDAAANESATSTASTVTTRAPLMVALGDSYSSGTGADTTPGPPDWRPFQTPWGFRISVEKPTIVATDLSVYERDANGAIKPCTRASNNAARRVATARDYELRDVACAGGTTASILDAGQNGEARQIDAVTPDAKLVTMTIGGNDVLLLAALGCVAEEDPCTDQSAYMVEVNQRIAALQPKIAAVIDAIAERAPDAQVRFAGYPYLLPQPGTPNNFYMCSFGLLADSERVVLQRATDRTNAAIRAAVTAADNPKVRFVDPTTAGSPFMAIDSGSARDACGLSAKRWINGYGDSVPQDPKEPATPQVGGAYGAGHPNTLGYGYYADLYLASLSSG